MYEQCMYLFFSDKTKKLTIVFINCVHTDWYGPNCTKDVDECTRKQPCENGGLCNNHNNGYTCNCDNTGFEGQRECIILRILRK